MIDGTYDTAVSIEIPKHLIEFDDARGRLLPEVFDWIVENVAAEDAELVPVAGDWFCGDQQNWYWPTLTGFIVTFRHPRDAVMFKLRWAGVQTGDDT